MEVIRKKISIIGYIILVGIFWMQIGLIAQAENVDVPGYHEYTETENEKIDHWYGVAKGVYLREGICGIKDAGKGKVSVSGTTTAHVVCDAVKVGIYLDESSDGGKTFGQIGSYYFSRENASSCHGNKTDISVTSGWYYMARGGHSVINGSDTEMSATKTRALKCS
ncbi:MAG: hypothetical protein HFI22_10045 [Lachnospiraceae bacterium]|jgi:hypothetical protein|nr:hypothetical protein [Lachnospiraceae bacterium]